MNDSEEHLGFGGDNDMTTVKKITEHETTFEIRAAQPEQKELCFTNTRPEEECCVGHLRGDFGCGNQFYTSWWPHHDEIKATGFGREFDNIVNGLRHQGLLADLPTMSRRCVAYPDAQFDGQWTKQYAFRIDAPHIVAFLRCAPVRGDYNFYLYAYEKTQLLEYERQQKGLPKVCWSTLKTEPGVIAIKYGETGYYRWDTSSYPDTMTDQQIADTLNELGGITKPQLEAMKSGSMFGWQVPAADPKQYDENGKFISHNKPKSERSVR